MGFLRTEDITDYILLKIILILKIVPNLITNYNKSSSDRIYSPISAWWKQTEDSGSANLHSTVDLAATPKPRGKSDML